MAQADPEDGFLAQELPDRLNPIGDPFGVARPVGQENPVRFMGENASAVEEAGRTITSQFQSRRDRRILYLTPKSRTTTLKRVESRAVEG